MRAESPLRTRPQRPELEHHEDAPAASDPLAAVEDRPPARDEHEQRDEQRDRQREHEEERREHDVEGAEERVALAIRRLERELAVPADERVLQPCRLRHPAIVKGQLSVRRRSRSVKMQTASRSSARARPRYVHGTFARPVTGTLAEQKRSAPVPRPARHRVCGDRHTSTAFATLPKTPMSAATPAAVRADAPNERMTESSHPVYRRRRSRPGSYK